MAVLDGPVLCRAPEMAVWIGSSVQPGHVRCLAPDVVVWYVAVPSVDPLPDDRQRPDPAAHPGALPDRRQRLGAHPGRRARRAGREPRLADRPLRARGGDAAGDPLHGEGGALAVPRSAGAAEGLRRLPGATRARGRGGGRLRPCGARERRAGRHVPAGDVPALPPPPVAARGGAPRPGRPALRSFPSASSTPSGRCARASRSSASRMCTCTSPSRSTRPRARSRS